MGSTDYIRITPSPKRVRVTWKGKTIIDTTKALELREGTYPPVLYLPRAGANMALLKKTTHHTTCPHKGEASYFSLADGSAESANAIWTYETPKDSVAAIKEYLAFYPDRVDAIEVI